MEAIVQGVRHRTVTALLKKDTEQWSTRNKERG